MAKVQKKKPKTYRKPLVSVITPTLNNEASIEYFLRSLRQQTYPQIKIEVIIVDGGSKDKTVEIAKRYGARILNNTKVLAEPGVTLAMQKAQGDLLMILASDNIYKKADAIEKIVNVFKNPKIYAGFPKHESSPEDSIFSKYINTFTDPASHFIHGDAANARTFHRIYETIEGNRIYDVYDYKRGLASPLIAFAQGFTVRREFIRPKRERFDDVTPVLTLLDNGERIAYIHSVSLYHHTVRDFDHFVRKTRWQTRQALEKKEQGIAHRLNQLSSGQKFRFYFWPIYAFSIVLPVIRAFYGLLADRKLIWLFHPIISLISASASLVEAINFRIGRRLTISRR